MISSKKDNFLFCLGILLIAVLPQSSAFRVGPISGFFLEGGTLLGAMLFAILTAVLGYMRVKIPTATWYFLILAAFWSVQARVMGLPYAGISDIVAWSFVGIALLMWVCRAWQAQLGQDKALSLLAGVFAFGAVLQAIFGWLQYTETAHYLNGWVMHRDGVVEGQFGQRNHFAHYLMWGNLAFAWLWAQKRLPAWAAILGIGFISSTMGLVGSRTVFAYVLALVILLPAYYFLSGNKNGRTILGLAVAAGIVLLAQLAIDPILQLFHGDAIQSAAERMANGQFEQSGRSFEWKKAWLAFLSAPIFGHGWGSYAWQGFITNVYPTGFRIYENNVLFTHSHNSYLNLLAEMGIIGTLLVLGGLVWSIRGCFQRSNLSAAGVFVLTLMSVSLVHSVVEYPLWYLYFLIPFSLFIGFSPVPNEADLTPNVSSSLKKNMTALAIAVVMACGVGRSIWAYDDFLNYTGPTDVGVVERTNNITGLLRVTQTEPMFRYYAQLKLMDYLDVNDSHFPDWALENARENFRFRPYVNAYKYPLAAYQAGKIDEARDMMFMLYRYYPEKMPAYTVPLINTSHYPQLRDDMIEVCRKYIRDCPY